MDSTFRPDLEGSQAAKASRQTHLSAYNWPTKKQTGAAEASGNGAKRGSKQARLSEAASAATDKIWPAAHDKQLCRFLVPPQRETALQVNDSGSAAHFPGCSVVPRQLLKRMPG